MRAVTQKQVESYLKIILAIAAVILFVLCVLLVQEYHHLRRLDYIAAHGSVLRALRAHEPLGVNDAGSIQTWMTFDYVNHLFALPAQYLQTDLAITDSRYPHLTIAEYAEDQHLEQSTFLAQVQNAIRSYLASKQ
jgi:hypothetical protein